MADSTPTAPIKAPIEQDIANTNPLSDANNAVAAINRLGNSSEAPEAPEGIDAGPLAITTRSEAPLSPVQTTPVAPPPPPPQPNIAHKVADTMVHALTGSDGTAKDIQRRVLAGGLSALGTAFAGMGAAAKPGAVAPGGGFLGGFGVGAEAAANRQNAMRQQAAENQQKQQEIDLQKQKVNDEQSNADREYKLRQAEDARQQAASIREGALFEKRSQILDNDIAKGKFENVEAQANYLQQQADNWNDLQSHGAKPLIVNGVESPEFAHLGEAEDYATKNFDAAVHKDYKTRVVRDPGTGNWRIFETPYEPPKWHEITDADGQPQRIFTDTMGALAAQKQVAETRHYQNIASKSALDLKEDLESYKEEGSVKAARKELDNLGNGEDGLPQYSKLAPGSKSALLKDANDRFLKSQTALNKMAQENPDYATETDPTKKKAILDDMAANDPSIAALVKIRDSTASEIAGLTKPAWAQNQPKPNANPKPTPNPAKPNYQVGQQVKLKNGTIVTIKQLNPDGTFNY